MDSKQARQEALNLADFKIDDILSAPREQLLAEAAEDFGHPGFLAAAFDTIASAVTSGRDDGAVDQGAEAASQHALPGATAFPAILGPSAARRPFGVLGSFLQTALAMVAAWIAVPLQRRVVLGALASVLLVAALMPALYPRLTGQSDDRIAAVLPDDVARPSQAPALSRRSLPTDPAPAVSAARPLAALPMPPPAPASPPPAPAAQSQPAAAGTEPAAGASQRVRAPVAQFAPAPQQSTVAAEPPAAPPAAARGASPAAAAKSRAIGDGGGFVVQLSAWKSEAHAQSAFRALKLKYAGLKDHVPVIRREDDGKRGVTYAVRVGPLESRDDAEQLCKQLKAAVEACVVTKN
jgi:cell division septation protein DedD